MALWALITSRSLVWASPKQLDLSRNFGAVADKLSSATSVGIFLRAFGHASVAMALFSVVVEIFGPLCTWDLTEYLVINQRVIECRARADGSQFSTLH